MGIAPTKSVWKMFFHKQLENFASAKMLLFFLPFFASCGYLWWIIKVQYDIMTQTLAVAGAKPEVFQIAVATFEALTKTFSNWCTFTVALAGTVIACREIFKIQKIRALAENDNNEKENIEGFKP
jgi:hypothetical protein